MTNLPDAKAKQLPVSGSTSLGSPMATTAPKTVKKDGTIVVRAQVAPPRDKPAARKTATNKSVAAKKPKTTAAQPAAKKAAPVKNTTTKPAAKKAAAKPAAKKPAAKKAVAKKPVAKKAVAKKPVKKAAAKPAAKKTTAKKAVAKKPVAKKAVAKKLAKPAAKKATAKKTTAAKKTAAKKVAAKKPAAKKTTAKRATAKAATKKTTSSTTRKAPKRAAAKPARKATSRPAAKKATSRTASLGEQVYRRVEEVVATGRTAKDAFAVVAKERKMTPSNIQQHYYRFKRKAQTSGKKANASTRKTMGNVQGRALGAAASAVGKLPAKQRKQVAKGVVGATKRVQTAQTVGKEVAGDLTQVVDDLMNSFNELLAEARKNPQFRKAEKKIAAKFSR